MKLNIQVTIRDDIDDNGLLAFLEGELSDCLDDLIAEQEAGDLVVDTAIWTEDA